MLEKKAGGKKTGKSGKKGRAGKDKNVVEFLAKSVNVKKRVKDTNTREWGVPELHIRGDFEKWLCGSVPCGKKKRPGGTTCGGKEKEEKERKRKQSGGREGGKRDTEVEEVL